MYVTLNDMSDIPYIDKISKQLWYLCNSKPCFLCSTTEIDSTADKSQETRSKILLAAFNEIYKRGFQAASLSSILNNTGITKGALYHHFDNKIELGYVVLDEVIRDTIYSNWIEPMETTSDPITILKDLIIESYSLMTEEDVCLGCPLNNLAQEMSPIDDGFRDRIAGIYQEWQDVLESANERGKLAGNVNDSVDSKEIALLFIASLQGCMGLAKSVQKLDTLMTCIKALLDRLESVRPSKKSVTRQDK